MLVNSNCRPNHFPSWLLGFVVLTGAIFIHQRAWAVGAATTTTLTVTSSGSGVTTVPAGTVVTLTATVVAGTSPIAPGQVRFCDALAAHCEDSALLATAQLTSAGTATYKFRPGIGSHSYKAVFVGTSSYTKSSSPTLDLMVTPMGSYPTTTTIASSGSVGNYNLTATVVGTAGGPLSLAANVSFLDTTNGDASLGTASLGAATSDEIFTTASMPTVGEIPYAIVSGDFNGDGIPDLATANNTDGDVTILLGNGDGTFTLKSSPTVGTTPVSIVVSDFNGDGILDLAVANQGDNTVTVLLGNGDGTFTAKSTLTVGKGPDSIATGDFNGDGIPDLVVANGGDNTVSVLLGNGDGTFTLKSTPAVGNDPTSVAVADFNGDGIPDLATSNYNDSTVTVLLGAGDGTFTLKSSPSTGYNPDAIAVGDFNGDGIPDLVTAENTGTTDDLMTVLLGTGDGTFTAAPQIYGYYADCVAVVDLNGDGIPDLVTTQGAGSFELSIYLGNGDGTFTFLSNAPIYANPTSIAVGDFNGDGSPDLAAALKVVPAGAVSVVLNQSTQTATATLNSVSVPGSGIQQVEASYPGDTSFSSSTSNTVPLLAAQIPTTLTLSSSATTSVVGNQITLTATLSPFSEGTFSTNGETVTFYNGTTSIGTGMLSSGVAMLTTSSLPGGSDTLTAAYSGDGSFSASASGSVALTVSPIVATLQLYSSANPSAQGASITLTALLSPALVVGNYPDGETVTFYNGATVLGTGTLSVIGVGAANFEMASLNVTSLPNGIDNLTASYPGDGFYSAATSNTVAQAVNVSLPPVPNLVVTVSTDTTTGVASNCTSIPAPNCSLRDALAAAFAAGSGNITFDPTVFAVPQTIALGNAGGLNLPPHTTITGPTTGSGATLTNLVTVNGGGPVFTVNQFVTNAAISGLTITGGVTSDAGGGILNNGVLTVSGSTISGNTAGYSDVFGGGIENSGVMALIDSTVTGNSAVQSSPCFPSCYMIGGGIDNQGTLTITNSTVVGNNVSTNSLSASGPFYEVDGYGGGISNEGTLTMTNSTVAGNSGNGLSIGNNVSVQILGAGIYGGVTTGTNNIISGNTTNGTEDDCDSESCGTNGVAGNVIGVASLLAPLGNYGGPTQTAPPLPGSPAICAGLVADIPSGVTTDQRGSPRTTTYGSNPPCVDSGSVQTDYSVSFSTEPPSTVTLNTNFTAAVQLNENGNPFPVSGVSIPIALAADDNGTLNLSSLTTAASGIASSSQLQVSAAGTSDRITASLPVTTNPPPPSLTSALSVSAASDPFDVTPSSQSQTITFPAPASPVTFGVAPITLNATASSGLAVSYSVTGPASISGSMLVISGAGTVVVTASQSGDSNYSAAPTVSRTIVVNKAASSTSLTSSSTNANLNASVTFTATVASTAGVPAGSVQFLNGTTSIGTSTLNAQGVATLAVSTLPAGSSTISAVYAGDSNFTGSQATLTQVVTGPGFIISANPTTLSLKAGQTGTITITLTPVGGYQGSLNFACTGLPQYTTCSFNPATLTADGSNTAVTTTMTITTTGSNTGTVSKLDLGLSNPAGTHALLCWLPGCLIGFVLCWKRKRLSRTYRNAIWLLLLALCISGLAACGGGGMSGSSGGSGSSTPAGTSTITVTASGSGSTSQTLTLSLTVTN
jgi:Bacterial Ig-like domain (group 3)/FG-GAP-like repeat